jgi:hypothetical protein
MLISTLVELAVWDGPLEGGEDSLAMFFAQNGAPCHPRKWTDPNVKSSSLVCYLVPRVGQRP